MIRRQTHPHSRCAPCRTGEQRGVAWQLLKPAAPSRPRDTPQWEVMDQVSFYDAVGGAETFNAIVSRFYAQVPEDEILREVYPLDDLEGAEERLRMFLEQYWGGPRTYSDRRGHPRLRMRHAPFRITPIERDAWMR